ncbi:hypothetical protein VB267_03325, partial [Enterobacter hormaechei]|nr:hypothetical protein [Enterobacter hormaechei]
CGKKIGPDPRNFNQRVSLGRNDLLIRTFPRLKTAVRYLFLILPPPLEEVFNYTQQCHTCQYFWCPFQ